MVNRKKQQTGQSCTHRGWRRAAYAFAAALPLFAGCVSFDSLTKQGEAFPRAESCGACHVDIYREWKASPHAVAFSRQSFRDATDSYRFGRCLGCHAPGTLEGKGRPAARGVAHEEGVTCASCHLRNSKLSGPLKPTGVVKPHPIGIVTGEFTDGSLCGRCHEGAYREWKAQSPAPQDSCQSCHMPRVHRKMTQATDLISRPLVAFENESETGSHSLAPLSAGVARPPVEVAVSATGTNAVVTVRNLLPHSIPCGDFGPRMVTIRVEALSEQGAAEPVLRKDLSKRLRTELAPGGTLEESFSLPPGTGRVRVSVERAGESAGHLLHRAEVKIP
jgi:hypothetical protein